MNPELPLTRARLTTPRAAAVAGILFSVLLIAALVLIRISVPADPKDAGGWLESGSTAVAIALNLVPFAGIAFLWFVGVIRDRLGEYEDKLFSTVFLGSGLLFLAMLFASAASAGGMISAFQTIPQRVIDAGLYGYGRATTYELMNIYAIKMAGVFMISTCTLFAAPEAHAAVDCASRLCTGAAAPAEHRLHQLDLDRLSALGAADQRVHPDRELP